MARLRWGADVPSGAEEARERLLDAAERCFAHYGVAKTTVEDVASQARVSRATVYRYFEGRDELLMGVLFREGARFMEELAASFDPGVDPGVALVETAVATIEGVRGNDRLAMLFAPEVAGLTLTLPRARDRILRMTARYLGPILLAAREQGRLRDGVDIDEAAEFVLRLTLSMLGLDDLANTRDSAELREFLRRFLLPPLLVSDQTATVHR